MSSSHFAKTFCEKLLYLTFYLQNIGQRHGGENRYYLRRSIANVSMCIAEFFHFKHIEIENVGQRYGGEKRDLRRSITMCECVLLNFFIILMSGSIRKRTNFIYLNI